MTAYRFVICLLFVSIFIRPFHFDSIAGEFYKWTDKRGTIHFTDNYLSVPPQYRRQIKIQKVRDSAEKEGVKTTIESSSPYVKKPAPEGKKIAPDGEIVFNEKCSKCHSLTGKNPNDSATQLVGLLNVDNFKESALPVTEDSVKKIIKEGGGEDMPSFSELTDKELTELMKYLTPFMKKK